MSTPDVGFFDRCCEILQEPAFEILDVEIQWIHVLVFVMVCLIIMLITIYIRRVRCQAETLRRQEIKADVATAGVYPVADMV